MVCHPGKVADLLVLLASNRVAGGEGSRSGREHDPIWLHASLMGRVTDGR
jgi:hypothetical protein